MSFTRAEQTGESMREQIQTDPYRGIRVITDEVLAELKSRWAARLSKMSTFEQAARNHLYNEQEEEDMFSYWIDELDGLPTPEYYDWVTMNWDMDDDIRKKKELKKRRLGNTPAEQEFEDKHGYAWWEPEGWERGGKEYITSMGYGEKERESRFRYEVMKG